MKKNNSRKLILAAVLFFSGGMILPLGKQEIVNAAQENQIEQEGEDLVDVSETTNKAENIDETGENAKDETEDERKEIAGNEENEENTKEETEGETQEDIEEEAGEETKGETQKDTGEKLGEEIKGETQEDIEEEAGEETKGETKEDTEEEAGEETKGETKEDTEEETGEETEKDTEENIEEDIGKVTKENTKEEVTEEKTDESEEDIEEVGIGETVENEKEANTEEELEKGSAEIIEKEENESEIKWGEGAETEKFENEVIKEEKDENAEINDKDLGEQVEVGQKEEKVEDTEPVVKPAKRPESVMVHQVNLSTGIPKQKDEISMIQEQQNLAEKVETKEIASQEEIDENVCVEVTNDFRLPVASIERLENKEGENGLRFYYQMQDENLVEHQIRVFYNSDGKEELILEEKDMAKGELCFTEEGNYLVYLYTKDELGNESRLYQNYTVGSFDLKMEELDKFKNQKIEIEDMEVLLEDVFEGSNVATYQLYINGEQYNKEASKIPEGKCILTIEMEDTYGNSGQKTIEIFAENTKAKEVIQETRNQEQSYDKTSEGEKVDEITEKIALDRESGVDEGSGVQNENRKKDTYAQSEKKDSSLPVQVAGIVGSLLSGALVLFRRIKH